MDTETSAPALSIPPRDARKILQAYVRQRLRKECEPHGQAAEVARSIGFSKPAISEVIRTDNGPGDRLMHALAAYWGMTFSQLEEAAKRTFEQPVPEPSAPPDA